MEKAGKPFEVVFASSDRSVKDMYKYMTDTKMPWVAVPHRGPISAALSQTYGVRGIPALIIIDEDGKVLSKNGRGDVMSSGAKAYEIWTQ